MAGCFTLIVFLMSCDCNCYVALPRGGVGNSAMSVYCCSLGVCGGLCLILVFVSFLVLH